MPILFLAGFSLYPLELLLDVGYASLGLAPSLHRGFGLGLCHDQGVLQLGLFRLQNMDLALQVLGASLGPLQLSDELLSALETGLEALDVRLGVGDGVVQEFELVQQGAILLYRPGILRLERPLVGLELIDSLLHLEAFRLR